MTSCDLAKGLEGGPEDSAACRWLQSANGRAGAGTPARMGKNSFLVLVQELLSIPGGGGETESAWAIAQPRKMSVNENWQGKQKCLESPPK
jgi:hypothetical protein